MAKISGKEIKRNLIMSLAAQVVSLSISFITNLVVPKFIDELQYAHWQTYILYINYVVLFHFGIFDGLVLRYSQYDYDELNKPLVRSQLQSVLILNLLFAFIGAGIAFGRLSGPSRSILLFVSMAMIISNAFTYTSYTFQITNRINKYARLVILQKLVFGCIVCALVIFKVNRFEYYCIADLLGSLTGCVFGVITNRDLFLGENISFREAISETLENFKAGILLLIANWTSVFVVIGAKTIIQMHWDILTFGKVSFSFSVTSLFLSFVTAISVVLFPSIKRMDESKLPQLYGSIRGIIVPLLFVSLLLYYPGCWVLEMWLPAYAVSLKYLGILLPIIVFSSLTSLLTNNYLKAYRYEKQMLYINLSSIVLAMALYALFAFCLDSLPGILISVVIATMVRSILSEIIISKLIKMELLKDFIIECFLVIVFIVLASIDVPWIAILGYLFALLVFLFIKRKTIFEYFSMIKSK